MAARSASDDVRHTKAAGTSFARLTLLTLLMVATPAGANEYRFVKAGDSVPLGPFFRVWLNDCTTRGFARVSILLSPKLGTLEILDRIEAPHLPITAPAHVCNDKKLPTNYVIYHARPGAAGIDEFSFALIYDFRRPIRHTYSIMVQ